MTGRNDYPHIGSMLGHTQRNRRRRHEVWRQKYLDAMRPQYTRSRFCKHLAPKTAIVPNHYLAASLPLQPAGSAFCNSFYIINGIVIGDDSSPTICSKFNCCHVDLPL